MSAQSAALRIEPAPDAPPHRPVRHSRATEAQREQAANDHAMKAQWALMHGWEQVRDYLPQNRWSNSILYPGEVIAYVAWLYDHRPSLGIQPPSEEVT